jgi:tetratricopeptide (TPR) repeat protein
MGILKARSLMEQKKYETALENLQHAVKKSFQVYALSGDCYYQQRNFPKAIENYLIADSIQKDAASFELARCYAQVNDNQKAIFWLQRHLASTHKKTEVEIISDKAFTGLNESIEWNSLWKKSWYTEQEITRNALAASIEKGKAADALNDLDRLKDNFYPKHEYFALLSKAYAKQNMNEPAISSINDAIKLYARADEYFAMRADLLLKTGKFTGSLDDMSKAIHLNPNIPAYYIKRAEIARLAGNYTLAETDLKLYQELNPESTNLYEQWGLLENKRGNYLNASDYYDKLIEKDQAKPQYFLERGTNSLSANQVIKADEDFGMALDLDPTLKDAFLQKGNAHMILQDTHGACYNWNKAKQLGSKEALNLIYQHCKE